MGNIAYAIVTSREADTPKNNIKMTCQGYDDEDGSVGDPFLVVVKCNKKNLSQSDMVLQNAVIAKCQALNAVANESTAAAAADALISGAVHIVVPEEE